MKPSIFPLFSSPIMVGGEGYQFSPGEKQFLADLDYRNNTSNLMSKDTRILENPALAELKNHIDSQLLIYKKKLLFMRDENEIYITQSWANVTRPGQFHPRHRHPNSLISGVMFIDTRADHPPLRFHRSAEIFPLELVYDELNEFNATCRVFDPVPGMLILFPSLLEHDVEVNRSQADRTSISFNTFVRGIIGGNEQLTEVDLKR